MGERLTPMYAVAMGAMTPILRWWGRLEVTGLDALPAEGPILLAGNHDSNWDPLAIGWAGRRRRQIRALAKDQLWRIPGLAPILNGMGQIPISRGKTDTAALERAILELQEREVCIGIFPEGTRTLGRELRARSGFGRLAEQVPEASVVCVTVQGTETLFHFPQRPRIRVHFFTPSGGGLQPGETASELSVRLLEEIRGRAPRVVAGNAGRRAGRERARTLERGHDA